MTVRTLGLFFVLAFGLSWIPRGVYMLFTDQLKPIFGELGYTNPLFILAVYAPAISGIGLVIRNYGLKGLGRYFRR